ISFVVSNRTSFAVANSIHAGGFNAFSDQGFTNGVCTTLGQVLVIGIATYGVSVTFNGSGYRRVGLHELGQALDVLTELRTDGVAVEVELDVQLNANGLHFWLGLRSRCRSGCRFSLGYNRSGTAAKVQTHAYASLPFGVAMVQTVQSINACLHEEVFVQVVLHTETSHSHGGAVILVGADLFQFLVSETTGNVRTQRTFAEVVNGFNVGQLAIDIFARVLAVVDFQTLISTQADVQQYIVSDKVA